MYIQVTKTVIPYCNFVLVSGVANGPSKGYQLWRADGTLKKAVKASSFTELTLKGMYWW